MLLHDLAETSARVAETSSRLGKVELLAACLRRAAPDEVPIAVAYLSGRLPQGSVGVGWAALRELPPPAPPPPRLELLEVDEAVAAVHAAAGPGSQARRRELLASLFGRATEAEVRFLTGLLLGELRQGALEGVMVDAVAAAAGAPAASVRRALMLSGDLGAVASAALAGGEGLAGFGLRVLQPVQPMLAQTADDVRSALARTGPAAVERKLDGARIQAHRLGDEVRIFTRNLADVTARLPEVAARVRELDAAAAILDGEAIALGPDGRPEPFQVTMSRFGTGDAARRTSLLRPFFFDLLHLDGDDLLDRPAEERAAALAAVAPDELLVPRLVPADEAAAEAFLDEAVAAGHEGVLVKALDAPYEAGRRGAAWVKVKRAHTLDLVVLAAEWGHGRRRGRLSNLHLGARDGNGWAMLGKTFKGMTDELLAWQTERLLELETGRDRHTVHVRPELVVEVAFDGVQASRRYPSGLALRFARVKGYRPDKPPAEADTVETVRAIHEGRSPG